ncbi:MAG: adenylate/guanylate cyclase domain-containing protein [Saprospiraceae bacterium]|nr:adenylate/guanylate cyclase domain-containing protein [Saprospiraceae bacterium]
MKTKIKKVLTIAVGWALIMLLFSIYEFSLLGKNGHYPNGAPYDHRVTLWMTPLTAFIGGLFLGAFEVFWLDERLRRRPFGISLLYRVVVYLGLLLFLVGIGVHLYNAGQVGGGLFSAEALLQTKAFISSIYMFIIVFIWSSGLLLVLLFLKISDSFGPGTLQKMLLGRYHQSRIEKRIFMFLDIRSSTAIAEKLGHVQYFKLLNDFFSDITDSILKFQGEIYQYVGDEVVVSWKPSQGADQANCIRCFLDIMKRIATVADRYEASYGLVPGFKAGFHYGEVTTGEVGILKKEIIYTGDVLNTTARIQSKCNELEAHILLSDELHVLLQGEPSIHFKRVGAFALRGRESKIGLYSVDPVG